MQSPVFPTVIQVALVDDDVDFQHTFCTAVQQAPDLSLLRMATTRAQGLRDVLMPPADVLVVDLGLPDGSGIDIIRAAHERWPACSIMVSTVFGDEAHVMQSLASGASGYLLKDSSPHSIVHEIRALHAGGSPISPMIARQILNRFQHGAQPGAQAASSTVDSPAPVSLSTRELQVLEYLTKGFTVTEIARLLAVSQHTVATFVRRIYAKLEVNTRAEAIAEAHLLGLLPGKR
jgi:DNA-binding NarL/FixJ family response regulator